MNHFDALTPGSVVIILLGVTFLGGAIGSFLNVVIYRLPVGLSLIYPPSRCPKCEHPIRPYDNVPVLGWIMLRGKCRDCNEPISVRYPTIEAIVSLTFLAVAWLEWFGPRYELVFPGSVSSAEAFVARAGLHVLLLTTLLGVGMIQWDGGRVPKSIWLPVILVNIACWTFFPSFAVGPAWEYKPTMMSSLINGLAGAAVGFAIGGIFWLIEMFLFQKRRTSSSAKQKDSVIVLSFLCIGLVFGWQAVLSIGLIYLPVLLVDAVLQRMNVAKRLLPHGLYLFVLTLGSIWMFCYVGF